MPSRFRFAVVAVVGTLLAASAPGAHPSPPDLGVGASYAPPDDGSTPSPQPPAATAEPAERASGVDQLDSVSGNQTHFLYFVPKDRPDQRLDADGTLQRSVDSLRAWFRAQMSKAPRVDRTSAGTYDITFVRGEKAASEYTSLSVLEMELSGRGFTQANKRYFVYAAIDRGGTCGEGRFPNVIVGEGRYAAAYLDSSHTCGARDFGSGSSAGAGKAETIVAHEWLHNEGIVSVLAPHHCAVSPYHVCTGPIPWASPDLDPESTDVMFPYINARLSAKVLDRNHDDYVDTPWPWIANLRDSTWME